MWQGMEVALGAMGAAPLSPKAAPALVIPGNLVASQQQIIRSIQSAAQKLMQLPNMHCTSHKLHACLINRGHE